MSRSRPGRLDDMLGDGTLYHLARISKTQADLARQCGISPDAYISWRMRRTRNGVATPTLEELQRGMPLEKDWPPAPGYSVDPQRIAQAFGAFDSPLPAREVSAGSAQVITDREDFADEEPTRPGVPSQSFDAAATQSFDVEPSGWSYPEAVNDNWRAREQPSDSKKLTKADCPDGTLILWASDIHIPIQDNDACRLMVECAERTGVSRVIAGGDILDMNCLSKHAKESRRTVEHATILEEVAPGRWLLDWFATKQTDLILGNHEDRLKRFIDENPAFHGSLVSNFAKVCDLPPGISVLPQGGEIRLGNMVWSHGDAEFKNSSGGQHPAAKLLSMAPDQSSMIGHLHRMAMARRTSRDEDGIHRTRCAWTMGHLSHEHMHYSYVGKSPNWQVGFGLIRVYWEGERPRWSVYPIEVLFDRYNRRYFEHEGHVYR